MLLVILHFYCQPSIPTKKAMPKALTYWIPAFARMTRVVDFSFHPGALRVPGYGFCVGRSVGP